MAGCKSNCCQIPGQGSLCPGHGLATRAVTNPWYPNWNWFRPGPVPYSLKSGYILGLNVDLFIKSGRSETFHADPTQDLDPTRLAIGWEQVVPRLPDLDPLKYR